MKANRNLFFHIFKRRFHFFVFVSVFCRSCYVYPTALALTLAGDHSLSDVSTHLARQTSSAGNQMRANGFISRGSGTGLLTRRLSLVDVRFPDLENMEELCSRNSSLLSLRHTHRCTPLPSPSRTNKQTNKKQTNNEQTNKQWTNTERINKHTHTHTHTQSFGDNLSINELLTCASALLSFIKRVLCIYKRTCINTCNDTHPRARACMHARKLFTLSYTKCLRLLYQFSDKEIFIYQICLWKYVTVFYNVMMFTRFHLLRLFVLCIYLI